MVAGAFVVFCLGGLVGAAWTTQVLGGVTRRHAMERRSLNDEWRALEDARAARGQSVHCARCHQQLSTSWQAASRVAADDGT
jgi:cell division protein FtsL